MKSKNVTSSKPFGRSAWVRPADDSGLPNQWHYFRASVDVRKGAGSAADLRIACDSRYWLWWNGKLIVREGGLKRGGDPLATFFDEIDLRAHVTDGPNTVALLLWYFGRSGFTHHTGPTPLLRVQGAGVLGSLRTSPDWKARRHPAFYDLLATQTNHRIPESQFGFDARLDDPEWTSAAYDDSAWRPAVIAEPKMLRNCQRLLPRPVPMFWYGEEQPYLATRQEGNRLIATLPVAAQVLPRIRLEAPAGRVVTIRSDAYATGGRPLHQSMKVEYRTRDGVQEFESPAWISGHQMIYDLPDDAQNVSVNFRPTTYDADPVGQFHVKNDALNVLHDKARRTLLICMRDTFYDCPDRERSLYAFDALLEMRQALYGFDEKAWRLCRQTILDIVATQRDDGSIYAPIGGLWGEELPHQCLSLVGRLGVWQYYQHTGDRDLLASTYDAIKRYVGLWKLDADGLVEQRRAEWYWCDWGREIDERLLDCLWYLLAIQGLAEAAAVLNRRADVRAFRRIEQRAVQAVQKHCFTGEAFRFPSYTGQTDDRANALAVLSGVATEAQYGLLTSVLMRERHASPAMEGFVLEALYAMRRPDDATTRMIERFGPMISSPYTTLWEQWDFKNPVESTSTYNHGWSGAALHLLPQYVAGIRPVETGFRRFVVQPSALAFAGVVARVPTPHGVIAMRITSESWGSFLELRCPPGTTAEVRIPREKVRRKLKVNNRILAGTFQARSLAGAKLLEGDTDAYCLELSEGIWDIEAI